MSARLAMTCLSAPIDKGAKLLMNRSVVSVSFVTGKESLAMFQLVAT